MGPFATITQPKKAPGELLREVRTAYGISQGELATRANTTQSAISRIEAGKVSPSFETLRELLRLLNADLVIDAPARDSGVDGTLIEGNFRHSPSDRVERGLDSVDPGPLLGALDRNHVDFVVIGGVAGLAHGSAYPTYDLDIAYARNRRNLERMAAALRGIGVTLRGAPEDVPFHVDARALDAGMNFSFATEFGSFDILGQIEGVRGYDELRAQSEVQEVGGLPVRVASLNHLIGMKRRADRTKDQLMVEEYIVMERLRREWDARHRDGGD
jgi:transcriptional regulator with XRE-family HTH domain